MKTSILLIVLLFFVAGLLLRILVSYFDSHILRFAWDYLVRYEGEESNETKETLLERISVWYSASRLARLMAILLVIPPFLIIWQSSSELLRYLNFPAIESGILLLSLKLGLMAFLFTLCFALIDSYLLKGLYKEDRPSHLERKQFEWLLEEDEAIPPLPAAGALLWDWAVHGSSWLAHLFKLSRPRAYIFEVDEEVLMAVGEKEMSALEGKRDVHTLSKAHVHRTESEMIRAIQRLDESLVREVMRPISKVAAVSLNNLTAERLLQLARRTGYTRFPCYYDQITNIIGYLNVYDLFESPVLPKDLRSLVRQVPYITELAHVDSALEEMLRRKSQIAICFDEYGGCSGLLTREDILEVITGDIMDEYDRPEEIQLETRRSYFIAEGTINLDDLEERTGLELETDISDTLAGYIYHRLSRVPKRGESIEESGWRLEVVRMEKHLIRKVRLYPPEENSSKPSD